MSKFTERQKQELALLADLADSDIDTSDIPEQMDWNAAERGKFYRPVKQSVTIRLDADIIAWLKAQGENIRVISTKHSENTLKVPRR